MKSIEKIEDLIEGEIYYQFISYDFIFVYRKHRINNKNHIGYGSYLYPSGKSFYNNNHKRYNGTNIKTVRHASYQEKQQLLNSIKAGKYIEITKELEYEIY